jgi:hypothetical protein
VIRAVKQEQPVNKDKQTADLSRLEINLEDSRIVSRMLGCEDAVEESEDDDEGTLLLELCIGKTKKITCRFCDLHTLM